MEIHDKFQTITSSNEVSQFLTPLKELGINYFHYGKMFKNGFLALLVSNAQWHKHVFRMEKPGPWPTTDQYQLESGCYLWENMYDPSLIQDARNYFNFGTGIVLINQYDDFYDTFSFGMSKTSSHNPFEFFLNHLEMLKQFTAFFKDSASKLILQAENNKLILPDSMKKNNNFKIKNQETDQIKRKISKCIQLSEKGLLTPREFECLKYLARGKTMKEIALYSNISPRTVEARINNIKKKLSCNLKTELINKFWESFG